MSNNSRSKFSFLQLKKLNENDFQGQIISAAYLSAETPDSLSIFYLNLIKTKKGHRKCRHVGNDLTIVDNESTISIYYDARQREAFACRINPIYLRHITNSLMKYTKKSNLLYGCHNRVNFAEIENFFGKNCLASWEQNIKICQNFPKLDKFQQDTAYPLFCDELNAIRKFPDNKSDKLNYKSRLSVVKKIKKMSKGIRVSQRRIIIKEDWHDWFRLEFEGMTKKGYNIIQMKKEMENNVEEIKKMSKTTFYKRFIKEKGFRYHKIKPRFGVEWSEKKSQCRLITSSLIGELFCRDEPLYYYDECTFTLNDYRKKYWTAPDSSRPLNFRNPVLKYKLNVILSKQGLVTFQVSKNSHKKEDVLKFVVESLDFIIKSQPKVQPVRLVLDNSPKNRSQELATEAKKKGYTLIFITLGVPKENMAENCFFYLKHEFSRLKNLNLINKAPRPPFRMLQIILETMRNFVLKDFERVKRLYIPGLIRNFNLNH